MTEVDGVACWVGVEVAYTDGGNDALFVEVGWAVGEDEVIDFGAEVAGKTSNLTSTSQFPNPLLQKPSAALSSFAAPSSQQRPTR